MARMNEEAAASAEDVKNKAANLGGSVREFAGNISDAAQQQYEHIKDQAQEYYDRGRQRAMDLEDNMEDYIREKPVQAILLAAGVGLLIGLLWRRH